MNLRNRTVKFYTPILSVGCVAVAVGFTTPAQAVVVNLIAHADVDLRSADLAPHGFDRTVMVIGNGGGDPATQRNFKGMVRFELPADFATATSATFELTRAVARNFNAGMNVSGLNDGPADNWLEVNGSNIGPVGSDPNLVGTTWNNAPGNIVTSTFEFSDSSLLGTFTTLGTSNGGASGDTYSITGANLVNFLNLDSNGFVTLLLGRNNVSSQQEQWAAENHTSLAAPTLILEYTPIPEPASLALMGLGGLVLVVRKR